MCGYYLSRVFPEFFIFCRYTDWYTKNGILVYRLWYTGSIPIQILRRMMSRQIKVSDEVHQKLMGAKSGTETVSGLIARLLDYDERRRACIANIDEADALVDKLDYEAEHPESSLSPEDSAILENLAPGELPECCQEIFDDPEHPVPTCKHWRKAYENFYGQRMWGYVNDLVGGGYRTWFSKYVK